MADVERTRIVHFNLLDQAAITCPVAGAWSPDLSFLTDMRIKSAPARCLHPANPAASRFLIDFGRTETWGVFGLFAHTCRPGARIRLTGAADAAVTQWVQDAGWFPMIPRVHASWPAPGRQSLPWTAPNFWTGQPTDRELDAYGRQFVVTLPARMQGRYLRVEIDNGPDVYDLGYGFVGDFLLPDVNVSRGEAVEVEWRTLVDEAPSGHAVFEWRRPARTGVIPYSRVNAETFRALRDVAMVNGPNKPVLVIPYDTDPRDLYRSVYLARLTAPPGGEVAGFDAIKTGIKIKEITA